MKLLVEAIHAQRSSSSSAQNATDLVEWEDSQITLYEPEESVPDGSLVYSAGYRMLQNAPISSYLVPLVSVEITKDFVYFVHGLHEDIYQAGRPDGAQDAQGLTRQLVNAIVDLHSHGIVHGNLQSSQLYLNANAQLKLSGWWLFQSTNYGLWVDFPVGSFKYSAPERLLSFFGYQAYAGDIWSLGVLAAEFITGQELFTIEELLQILTLSDAQGSLDQLVTDSLAQNGSEQASQFVKLCLKIQPSQRPSITSLVHHPYIYNGDYTGSLNLNSSDQVVELQTMFQLWKLADGRFGQIHKNGKTPPIYTLPRLVKQQAPQTGQYLTPSAGKRKHTAYHNFGFEIDSGVDPTQLFTEEIYELSLDRVEAKLLSSDDLRDAKLSEVSNKQCLLGSIKVKDALVEVPSVNIEYPVKPQLSLHLREKDVRYQKQLISCFQKLLPGLPFTHSQVVELCQLYDIPSFVAGAIWIVLLNVNQIDCIEFNNIDTLKEQEIDRQLDLDLPRCHPYHRHIGTQVGRDSIRAVLKAWLFSNPSLVYWQGLDSVCAPFVVVHTNSQEPRKKILSTSQDAKSYACLDKFVQQFLCGFFRSDNNKVLNYHLHLMRVLLLWFDHELLQRMDEIGLSFDLFAIPWLLTLFAHVLSIDKTIQLWNLIFIENSKHPQNGSFGGTIAIFVGIAILTEPTVRQHILTSESFIECLPWISGSNLIALDMELLFTQTLKLRIECVQSMYTQLSGSTSPASGGLIPCYIADMEPIAHISPYDFAQLPTDQFIVVDIRSKVKYENEHHENALYVEDVNAFVVDKVYKHIVVVGDNEHSPLKSARILASKYSRVSILSCQ